MITNSCMPHAPMYLQDYPKVTLLGGPLSHTHLHRCNCVPELHDGSCELPVRQHCDEMVHALSSNPEGHFDLADEEVRAIINRCQDGQRVDDVRDVGAPKLNVFEPSSDSESIEVL